MITYEYKCESTGAEIERQMRISQYVNTVVCSCGASAKRDLRTVPAADTYFEGSYKAEASIAGN